MLGRAGWVMYATTRVLVRCWMLDAGCWTLAGRGFHIKGHDLQHCKSAVPLLAYDPEYNIHSGQTTVAPHNPPSLFAH